MSVFAFGRQCRNRSNDIYDRSARGTDEFDLLSYSQCNKPRFSLVYARLRGVVGQVLPRKRGRHHVENWSVDTNLRPLFGHSPLFCLLDAHCDALFLFALKTVHRRSRSRAQGNIDSIFWITFVDRIFLPFQGCFAKFQLIRSSQCHQNDILHVE